MAVNSTFTPKASLTEAPTNLKEAIDWVLRVTGKDGKELNKETECICGLAAAVTDLLQSVELQYHGYQGEGTDPKKGANSDKVKEHLNGLFSLVQGLGGTSVVRTYIDQLAQVLSALVGWSKIVTCENNGSGGKCQKDNKKHHGLDGCAYLNDIKPENKCETCGCMKWVRPQRGIDWVQLGRGCTRCKGSGSEEEKKKQECKCGTNGCSTGKECQCAKDGRCCKCYCKDTCGCKKDAKCSCVKEEKKNGTSDLERRIYKDTYQSAYGEMNFISIYDGSDYRIRSTWTDLLERGGSNTPSQRRHQCARILLGSVCLIWSGLTYMYWTGKYHSSSPRWNNHILDGSGLDDGTLSQWLQALGFPRDMLNNHGPGNRWDAVIWDGIMGKLYLGFPNTSTWYGAHGHDQHANTFRQPAGMNYAGYIHTVDRGAFCSNATVFRNGTTSITEENINKCGALYKLYILSCAYFTGLQNKAPPKGGNTNPKTIREILYWLSALPYSPAYPKILTHSKGILEKVAPDVGDKKQLSFYQTGRTAPITVHEFNLFAHFQAVTQYCPLVLIGIQGGLGKSTDSTNEPPIHALYANTECNFTYPTVDIQAYNQVVHYIRGLFYQLYFLRKQCAVKVTCGGKWRECRYGKDVVSKGVISWMCLGCDPMEHDRKWRVEKVNGELGKVVSSGKSDDVAVKVKDVLEKIGDVVVQLGNAQEALEGKKKEAIEGVKTALERAKTELGKARTGLEGEVKGELEFELVGDDEATKALRELMGNNGKGGLLGDLTKSGDKGALDTLANDTGPGSLDKAANGEEWQKDYSSAKDKISEVINQVREALDALREWLKKQDDELNGYQGALLKATEQLLSICNSPNCPPCNDHINKCGKTPKSKTCDKCHQQYMDGFPSPLQAFLEDRLPGFSCKEVVNQEKEQPDYPPAASHLGHCGGSGQCCPLPMGFRGQFYSGCISDMTGQRLYGILYFFSNGDMMQSCVYTLVRVTAALSATTPQVLGDVFGFFRGGVGNPVQKEGDDRKSCGHTEDPKTSTGNDKYFCGWCASGLRDVVKEIEWIPNGNGTPGGQYMDKVGKALVNIKGDKGASSAATPNTSLSRLTKNCQYLSPLTGELYTAVSATFGGTYLSWVLYLSDALHSGLESLASEFQQIECRGCKGQCDPNKCKKGSHGATGNSQCNCSSIVSCTGVLPVLYRHGFSYGNPFNLEGYQQENKESGDYSITDKGGKKHCHEFLSTLSAVIKKKEADQNASQSQDHPLSNLLSQVGKLQYDIRLPWIFVLTLAWLVAVLYLAFGAIWPLDWTHMRSHWLRGGEHQWQCMWYKVMTGRKGVDLMEYFGRR